jgi:alkylated DNA repair dioxygenase AlkB
MIIYIINIYSLKSQNKMKLRLNIVDDTKELEEHKIYGGGIIKFCPNYLSKNESTLLFNELITNCNFSQSDIIVGDKLCKTPRLQAFMSDNNINADVYTKNPAILWSDSVLSLKNKLEKLLNCQFNYCLLNLYRDGKDYISYHADREAISEECNTIASISLGASRRFILKNNANKDDKIEYLLLSGSLIVMSGTTQEYWKHSVPKMLKVTEPRLNLTFRRSI